MALRLMIQNMQHVADWLLSQRTHKIHVCMCHRHSLYHIDVYQNHTASLTVSRAVMMESFFDKSDMDLASIDCSCRPVMSVCNTQHRDGIK